MLLAAVSLVTALWGMLSRNRIFEYPVIVSLFFIAWLIPQGIYIERMGISAQYNGTTLWYYVIACFLLLAAGFYSSSRYRSRRVRRGPQSPDNPGDTYDFGALKVGTVGLVAVGFVCSILLVRTISSENLGGQWTGIVTAYALGMNALNYGLCLAFLLYLRRPSAMLLLLMAIAVLGVLPVVMAGVKRAGLFELAFIFAAGWFFTKKKSPPRIAILAAFLFGTVLLHQIGAVRAYVKDGRGNAAEAVLEGVQFRTF
jgi:hypothetical protein